MRRDLRRTEADLEVTRMRLERRNQQLGKMPAGDERVLSNGPAAGPASLAGRNDMARAEYDALVRALQLAPGQTGFAVEVERRAGTRLVRCST